MASTADVSEQTSDDGLLAGRYLVADAIGKGGQARTYRARDTETGRQVAVKILRFDQLDNMKATELFEREAEALRSIDHPSIPEYVDYFHDRTDEGIDRYCLVQAYVDGGPLDALLEEGWRLDEEEARQLAREVLEILQYLHGLDPPVIHRDIKPSNILRRNEGGYVLVDFGGVRVTLPDDEAGSTIIGSHGHMAHEQLMGRAEPASDLYGLGATLIHLLSRKHPSEMTRGMELDFKEHIRVSSDFESFLEGLVQPDVEDRYDSADEALQVLESGVPTEAGGGLLARTPDSSRLDVQTDSDEGRRKVVVHFDALSLPARLVATCRHMLRFLLDGKVRTRLFGYGCVLASFVGFPVLLAFLSEARPVSTLLALVIPACIFVPWLTHSFYASRGVRGLRYLERSLRATGACTLRFTISPELQVVPYVWTCGGEERQRGSLPRSAAIEETPYWPDGDTAETSVTIETEREPIRLPPGLSFRDREWLLEIIHSEMGRARKRTETLHICLEGAYSKGGIPMNISVDVGVKNASPPEDRDDAIEQLSDPDTRDEFAATIEGRLRSMVAEMTPEEIDAHRGDVPDWWIEDANRKLEGAFDLHLDGLDVQHVDDERGYLDALDETESN